MDQKLYEIKKAKLTGDEVVVQHNELVDAPRILNQQEQKLFLFLISKINPQDREFFTFRVTVKEFAKAVGVKNNNNVYKNLMEISKRLMSKVLTIHLPDEKIITQTNILDYIDYHYGEGYADVRLSHKLAPYLLGLKRDFTQYKLSQVIGLSSVHAMRVYEMLKKQEKLGIRTFFIDDLRKKLNIHEGQYKRISNLKTRILEIAKREINEKTDILIDISLQKAGKKFETVQFNITPKNQKKAEKQLNLLESYNGLSDSEYTPKIMEYGFNRKAATKMLNGLPDHVILSALAAVNEQIINGKCKNPKAMLLTALKEHWRPKNSQTELQSHVNNPVPLENHSQDAQKATEDIPVHKGKLSGFFHSLNKLFNR